MSSPKIIVLCGTSREASLVSHLIAGLAVRGLCVEVQRTRVGEAIVLEDGVEYLNLVQGPNITDVQKELEKLRSLKCMDFDCAYDEMPMSNGHHKGTAFYNNLPKYRRRDKRHVRKG